ALQALGVADFGENRVEPARAKRAALSGSYRLHMVGNVQRRKAKDVIELFDCVHSVDRVELAEALSRRAGEQGKTLDMFVEVNVSGEASKHGLAPDDLPPALDRIRALPHLQVRGLMTMAPFVDDPEAVRPVFAGLRALAERTG